MFVALRGGIRAAEPPPAAAPADDLFRRGAFAEAERAYADAATVNPADADAHRRLGEIALLSNRLDEAAQRLSRALALRPGDERATALLAETRYRQDRFADAAPLFRKIGRTAMADKLDSFRGDQPYRVLADAAVAEVAFALTDPLPVVRVSVNGKEPANFIIDTGGAEVILDPEFADAVGARRFGPESGTFGGDKKADYLHARVESLKLGGLAVENVPVHLLGTRRFAAAAAGQRIDGILGTVLFYHFLTTLDYPNGRLILRTKAPTGDESAPGTHAIPFWVAGDHLMIAEGRPNDAEPCLMLVDTGLAGGGFTCPQSTLRAAAVDLASSQSFDGVGGGGTVKVTPFVLDRLSLGAARRQNIVSFFGAFPESLENGQGFRICGLVSHGFFRPFAVTFDFRAMHIYLNDQGRQ
jgi:predicted aspartyl protease